ncbi:hypothetical protein K466DRAFT_328353 [Polyporus arcularius HHB13444]|uniref:Uncharacterized protein n=1 Tax=Polyporus arcularius HHB13444 TaxID=1314778 RepID=A0A5C3NYV2_9APHY|nr:hypothetical protein K466DRAFT_328353 [Polyporus arcularius HHB13444]
MDVVTYSTARPGVSAYAYRDPASVIRGGPSPGTCLTGSLARSPGNARRLASRLPFPQREDRKANRLTRRPDIRMSRVGRSHSLRGRRHLTHLQAPSLCIRRPFPSLGSGGAKVRLPPSGSMFHLDIARRSGPRGDANNASLASLQCGHSEGRESPLIRRLDVDPSDYAQCLHVAQGLLRHRSAALPAPLHAAIQHTHHSSYLQGCCTANAARCSAGTSRHQ